MPQRVSDYRLREFIGPGPAAVASFLAVDHFAHLRRWCKSMVRWLVQWTAWFLGKILPLSTRRSLVTWVGRRGLPCGLEFAMGMLDGPRRRDPVEFHRFLWSNHLAYAETYEIPTRFGASNINPSRRILFRQIVTHLESRGLEPARDVRSVFEIGCSMGYLLRHLEEEVFPSATILHGLDIDTYAIQSGMEHLSALRSRVKLFSADMADSGRVMGRENYDLVLCCGVLMYVNESTAEQVLRTMFSRADRLVGLICLAPEADLGQSRLRASDGAFIHNMDKLISATGGVVLSSDHIGASVSGSSASHVILAEPLNAGSRR